MGFLPRIVLAAALVSLAPTVAQAAKQAVASPALQKEFDAFIEKFRAAVKADDPAAMNVAPATSSLRLSLSQIFSNEATK